MRLAPSPNRYPVPRDDVVDATRDLIAVTGGAVHLGGASAGASLALSAAREMADAPLLGLALVYGTFHPELPPRDAALRARVRGRHAFGQFTPWVVRRMNLNYAGSVEKLPLAHPGGSDLGDLPPVLLLDADRDTLRASSAQLAHELAGRDVEHHVIADTRHGFLDRPDEGAFADGIQRLTTWLSAHDVR